MPMEPENIPLNRVRLEFPSRPLQNLPGMLAKEMQTLRSRVRPGMQVAVAVGSRGITNLAQIVQGVVKALTAFGANVFLIPAMGSHGGATAWGQANLLAGYGVTEETMGAPVRSSMEVVALGSLPGEEGMPPLPLYMDKLAHEADGIFVIGRVKPHTDFHGPHESGIAKMLSIGLGKHAQALAAHAGLSHGLSRNIPRMAQAVLDTGKILGALAVVEDGYDQTSILKAVPPKALLQTDAALLKEARAMLPRLPFKTLQALLVDQLGKDVSGTGMDTNIIGRTGISGQPDGEPHITTLCVFSLTPQSHGNALGIGFADLIPKRLYDSVNWPVTYENVLTSRFVRRGAAPVTLDTDRAVVAAALRCCGPATPGTLRLARIQNTLHLGEILLSDACARELEQNGRGQILQRNVRLAFGPDGTLAPMQQREEA